MTVHSFRSPAHRPSVQSEEERAWISFYHRAQHNPAIAAEVLAQLDLDPEMKRAHLALYLRCRESLRLHEARAARDVRIGYCVRWIASALCVQGLLALRRTVGRSVAIVLACLPGMAQEPAKAKVRRLATDPKVRAARSAFRGQPTGLVPAPADAASVPTDAAHPHAPAVVRAVGSA